jgi:arabinosyltransferase C
MTLRPEPVVALLLVSVLALALRFAEKPSGWSLAAAGMLVAFAIAAHPAGLIALAPLLAVGPHVGAWARTHGWPAATVVGAAVVAVLGVVLTVGSDAHQRASEGRLIRISGDATASWRDEVTRYLFVGAESTTLRRASVALMLVALASYLGRRRVASPFDVPGASLALALVLLIPTPSKWSWHFGALIGVAALTVAAEVARFRADEKTLRWPVRPLVAYGAIVLVVGWSLFPRADWSSEFGLRTLSWTFAFESRVTLVRLAVDALVVIFVALVLVTLIRRGRLAAWRLPWRLVPLLVPLVVVPLIAWNIAMLVADTVKTPAWTLARQNVESFTGDEGCGLADDTMVAAPASMRPLEPVGGRIDTRAPRWLAGIETPNPLRFALLERKNETRLELPWFRAPTGERIGFYVFSGLQPGDGVAARWGSAGEPGPRAQPWQPTRIPDLDIAYPNIIRWGFVPQGALPSRPPQTDAAQLALASTARPPHAIAATGAVAYRPTTLAALFRLPGARPLVWPNLLLYMPCARLPRLSSGIVEVPTLVVAHSDLVSIDRETAPFHGLIDLYPLRDLGVADSKVEPEGVAVYWVDRRIPGAVLAPASVLGA